MRILSFHAGAHDVSAAAFEDYKLVAAVAEERLTRLKNFGGVLPWLAIDEVLRIADWTRRDVEVIASTRGHFPNSCYRVPLRHEMNYVLKDWFGIKRPDRDLTFLCRRFATTDTHSLFRADRFLADNGFLPQTAIHFVNHHEAHALPALFYTDWDDALLYTSDGVGDNVSFSIRVLRDGRLDCFYGDDRWLVPAICEHGLARAYGYATIACGYRELRHEGKLVGLAARGEPKLAEELAACFHLGELGVVKSPFKHPQGAEARLTRFLA